PSLTGSRTSCVSRWGVFDMVGNVWEWVADWGVPATVYSDPLFDTGDINVMTTDPALSDPADGPGALLRGGYFLDGTGAGVFAVDGSAQPSRATNVIGFRCGR